MFKNHLKTAFRNFTKYKVGSGINIMGLAIALLTLFAIYDWVNHELSYDQMHKNPERIYRLELRQEKERTISLSPAIKTTLLDPIPEIENSIRLFKSSVLGGKTQVAHKETVFTDNEIVYTDENFFTVFSFPLKHGTKNGIFEKPNSVVLTQEAAKKYFGRENPLGRTLLVSNDQALEVTGVLHNLPSNSHIHFDMLVSMKSHPWGDINRIGLGSGYIYYHYLKLVKGVSPDRVVEKIDQQLAGIDLDFEWHPNFALRPLERIHLYSNGWNEFEANGSITLVYVFISIGFLILLIASINYINMVSVYALKRSKEIGVKKVMGAERRQLVFGFLIEAVLTVLIAFILALFLYELAKPMIAYLTGTRSGFFSGYWFVKALSGVLLFGLLIGVVPALLLTRISSADLISSKFSKIKTRFDSKNLLLTFQFCISTFLIIGTLVIYNQLQFMQNQKLGYDKEQVLILHTGFENLVNKVDVLKESLLTNPKVLAATSLSQVPNNIDTSEGVNLPDGERIEVSYMSVDKDFFRTLSVDIVKGKERIENIEISRDVSENNLENRFVVNEAFLAQMGENPQDALGQNIIIRHGNMEPGPILGVIDDFHFQSLHNPIAPLVLEFNPHSFQHLLVKLNTNDISETLASIENSWKKVADNLPFEYEFLDASYDALYQKEAKVGSLILVLSIISILISSMGLFGLSLFFVERKTKEIGIRKVLGASASKIFIILTTSFTKWIVIANLITWPIGYYIMAGWLENFAYKTTLGWWIFAIAGIIAFLLAIITISYQSVRAALLNPVKSLRTE